MSVHADAALRRQIELGLLRDACRRGLLTQAQLAALIQRRQARQRAQETPE